MRKSNYGEETPKQKTSSKIGWKSGEVRRCNVTLTDWLTLKTRPNARHISTQKLVTLLRATCCTKGIPSSFEKREFEILILGQVCVSLRVAVPAPQSETEARERRIFLTFRFALGGGGGGGVRLHVGYVCYAVLGCARNRREFESVIRNSMGNNICSINNAKFSEISTQLIIWDHRTLESVKISAHYDENEFSTSISKCSLWLELQW